MFALPGYDAFLGFLLIAAAVPALALITNKLLAPKSRAGERQLTYESGMEPIGGAWIQFNIRYYMFALVFVIFDVETVFLYPWAVAFHRLGILAFIEALIFITILLVALAYAWRKGALEWSPPGEISRRLPAQRSATCGKPAADRSVPLPSPVT